MPVSSSILQSGLISSRNWISLLLAVASGSCQWRTHIVQVGTLAGNPTFHCVLPHPGGRDWQLAVFTHPTRGVFKFFRDPSAISHPPGSQARPRRPAAPPSPGGPPSPAATEPPPQQCSWPSSAQRCAWDFHGSRWGFRVGLGCVRVGLGPTKDGALGGTEAQDYPEPFLKTAQTNYQCGSVFCECLFCGHPFLELAPRSPLAQ